MRVRITFTVDVTPDMLKVIAHYNDGEGFTRKATRAEVKEYYHNKQINTEVGFWDDWDDDVTRAKRDGAICVACLKPMPDNAESEYCSNKCRGF